MNELITKEDEAIICYFKSFDETLEGVKRLLAHSRPVLNGERYLTDRELSAKLKLSRRTLQDYRNEGRIPFIQLGGKILYRESDVEQLLRNAYREAYRQV